MSHGALNLNREVTAQPNECLITFQKAFLRHTGSCDPHERHFQLDVLVVCHPCITRHAFVSLGVRHKRCANDVVLGDRPYEISAVALLVPRLSRRLVLEEGAPV